jgi:hypothetical protein
MMKYTAIDGHVIESTSATTPIGIQQIQITRTVEGNIMTIVIRESSEQELIDYINQVSNAS